MKNIFILLVTLLSVVLKAQTDQKAIKRDIKFAHAAAEEAMTMAKLGSLAETIGVNPEVQQFGKKMMEEHSAMSHELDDLAAKLNIKLPTAISEHGQRKVNRLSSKSGTQFDKYYMKCMAKEYKRLISLYKSEKKSGKNDEIKAWAANKFPIIKDHHAMAKDLYRRIK
jgi:putative membrane protein